MLIFYKKIRNNNLLLLNIKKKPSTIMRMALNYFKLIDFYERIFEPFTAKKIKYR